ncbi:SIALI-17 repeat-containing surface protein [Streptococcus mitis]|uniref:Cell surface protein n=1 Tax=Streptococcus mitis TaxID=28037 RepID=A0A139Q886_STRMT|nr:SIALI-17 repeat-containing surface protein [Streptococcus mitis]KXT98785.1 cell surface protein precursor [Streptococcus mitis]
MKVQKLQKKYSFRTFKGIGLASAVVGMFFANQAVYADVTSGDKSETTVYDTDSLKIPTSAKTTFTDDQNPTKKVTVDAVIGEFRDRDENGLRKVKEYNPYRYDGIDTISYSKRNTVNHLLNSDHSQLTKPTVEVVGGGRIETKYVKEGIAYDTDGKAYRESIEDNDVYGVVVTKDIEVNGLPYNSVDTKIIKSGGKIYSPTQFNDIKVPVSPEDMHYKWGGVNYTNVTSNVYIVEETSDGHYGKFVKASNITTDQEAVLAWKKGQATAKDFIKANVTLQPGDTNFQPGETIFQPGDTILVIDRDTYAKGDGRKTVLRTDFVREKVATSPENNSENNTNTEAKYTDWKKVSSVEESRENYVYANKGVVTISDDLQKVKVVHTSTTTEEDEYIKREWTTTLETDYVIHEAITPIRAYKVRGGDNKGIVNRYYEPKFAIVTHNEPKPIYQAPEKPISEIPKESPKNELPEFTGGVVSDIPPVLEIPEYTGGVVSDIPPVLDVPEYTGGAVSDIPPVLDIPEYPEDKEDTKLIIPPIYTKLTLIITKWVDETGTPLKSADVKAPVELGQPNEAFEHGMIEGYEYVETIRNQEGDVVTHVFRKLNSEPKSEPKPAPTPTPQPEPKPAPTPTPQRNEELEIPKVSNKPVPSTDHSGGNTYPAPAMEVSQLPNTGTESNVALAAFGFVGILTGFSLVLRKKDSE